MHDAAAFLKLLERYGGLTGEGLIRAFLLDVMPGRLALVSSFGAESAVLLHMATAIDRSVPVIFLDTGKHFAETLAYRKTLCEFLELENVQDAKPVPAALAAADGAGTLSRDNPDACCYHRKVEPLDRAIAGYDGWMTGRKRYQGQARAELPSMELVDGRIKLNPLADFTPRDINDYFTAFGLPRHPLWEKGYSSIGCAPCTQVPVQDGDARSGRWAGSAKSECGIHLPRAASSK